MKKNLYIITGTGSGIGKALAEELIKNSINDVIGISRKNTIHSSQFRLIEQDLSLIQQVKSIEFPSPEDYNRISLINNAGFLGEITALSRIKLDSIEDIINVNYTSAMILSTLFIQKYQATPCLKSIINISSGASTNPYISWANYCSSKAAIEMLSRCIDLEQQEMTFPIHCFAIAPGVVDTAMQQSIRETDEENFAMRPKFEALYTENKLYNPSDVARKLIEVTENPTQYTERIFRIEF